MLLSATATKWSLTLSSPSFTAASRLQWAATSLAALRAPVICKQQTMQRTTTSLVNFWSQILTSVRGGFGKLRFFFFQNAPTPMMDCRSAKKNTVIINNNKNILSAERPPQQTCRSVSAVVENRGKSLRAVNTQCLWPRPRRAEGRLHARGVLSIGQQCDRCEKLGSVRLPHYEAVEGKCAQSEFSAARAGLAGIWWTW